MLKRLFAFFGLIDVGGVKSVPPIITKALSGARLSQLFNGLQLWVDEGDSLGLAVNGVFEPAETALCGKLLKSGDRVLDIGANVGYYTILFADWVGSAGKVFAVEPDPINLAMLEKNRLNLFPLTSNIQVLPFALSHSPGTARLYQNKDNLGMHRLYASVCASADFVDVPVAVGDTFNLAPLDFIKIDIEGFEPYALRGLKETLDASPNVKILMEFSPLSILEAGTKPSEFLRWMDVHNCCFFSLNRSQWVELDLGELLSQVALLELIDMPTLLGELQGRNGAGLFEHANKVLQLSGYNRPIVENLLCVKKKGKTQVQMLLNQAQA